jgi:hypothetical protein
MLRTLFTFALALTPAVAMAQPPTTGSTYTFLDPVFQGTVFCDTLEEVRHIATADQPEQVYQEYLMTANDRHEPTCAAIVPTGLVVEVLPLGVMERAGHHFNAWAVETRVGKITGYALYLEYFEMVTA